MTHEVKQYLETRRSVPSPLLREPGPDEGTLRAILTIAARVPDHGKLAPWRFIIYRKAEREAAAEQLIRIAEGAADEKDRRSRAEKARNFAVPPLVIGVIFAPVVDHPKIPVWEQQLSAGAVCLNLLHAAQAHGFAAQWLSGWAAYDPTAAAFLGIKAGERVAGFIHIGSSDVPGIERDRPDVPALTTEWHPAR